MENEKIAVLKARLEKPGSDEHMTVKGMKVVYEILIELCEGHEWNEGDPE